MATATLQDMLARTREIAATKAADLNTKYVRLVLRCARGEECDPASVLTALSALGKNPAEFAADVERTAERIELKAVADQLAVRTAAHTVARGKLTDIQVGYEAAFQKLRAEWAALESAASDECVVAETREREAREAIGRLVSTCQDAELPVRIHELLKERAQVQHQLDVRDKAIKSAGEKIADAEKAYAREQDGYMGEPHNFAGTRTAAELRVILNDGQKLIAEVTPQVKTLQDRLTEIDADVAALEVRKLEPWPVGAATR